MTATKIQPVAEICSASHDDAQFGERAIKPLCDISSFDYGTPLYAGAAPAAVTPRARDLLGIVRTAQAEARRLINGEDSGSDLAQTKLDLPETLRVLEHALSQPAAVAGPANDLAELAMLNKLVELGTQAYGALAESNSDDGPAGTAAYVRWQERRAEMGELIRAHVAPALEAPAHECCNSWFLSLPEGRQAVLRDDKWMLASAAYEAGRSTRVALEAPAAPRQEGDVFRALIEFLLIAEEPLSFLRRWNEGSFDICRREWPEAPDALYALAAAPQAPNCTRCSGSGEDPEGYLTHGRGPDDHTVDGPCRECDGTGSAPQAPAAPSDAQLLSEWDRVSGLTKATERRLACMRAVLKRWGSAAPAAPAVDAPIVWPKARDVGRIGDMSPSAHLRIGLDSDNDVWASIWDERGGATIEFCTPGTGGGKSSRTRMALLAVMVAMEADNAADPGRDWWAERNHAAQAAAKREHGHG